MLNSVELYGKKAELVSNLPLSLRLIISAGKHNVAS